MTRAEGAATFLHRYFMAIDRRMVHFQGLGTGPTMQTEFNSIVMRDDVFPAMKLRIAVLWAVIPGTGVTGYRRFGGPRCLHLLGENGGSVVTVSHNPEDRDFIPSSVRVGIQANKNT